MKMDFHHLNQKILQAKALKQFEHSRETFFPRDLLLLTNDCLLDQDEQTLLNFSLTEKIKYLHKIETDPDRLLMMSAVKIFLERVRLGILERLWGNYAGGRVLRFGIHILGYLPVQ